jgi:hypothetical protein
MLGERPASLPEPGRRRCRALASFRADGRAPPRSTDMAVDAARRRRGRGCASRRAGTRERNRAPRARDAARAIIDREVSTAQTNGQPAPRTMHYHHDISGDSGPRAPGPNERNSRNSRDALAEEHERPQDDSVRTQELPAHAGAHSGGGCPRRLSPKSRIFCLRATRIAGAALTQSRSSSRVISPPRSPSAMAWARLRAPACPGSVGHDSPPST